MICDKCKTEIDLKKVKTKRIALSRDIFYCPKCNTKYDLYNINNSSFKKIKLENGKFQLVRKFKKVKMSKKERLKRRRELKKYQEQLNNVN